MRGPWQQGCLGVDVGCVYRTRNHSFWESIRLSNLDSEARAQPHRRGGGAEEAWEGHPGAVRLRGMETTLMETILTFASVSLKKNRNSLTWVLVALTVCFTYPVLYRVSAES